MKKILCCVVCVCTILVQLRFDVFAVTAYSADDLICTMNGSPVQGEFSCGDFSVTLPLDTASERENPPCVVAAQYNARGLLGRGFSRPAADGMAVIAELSISEVKDTAVRIYIWDGSNTMRPLIEEPVVLQAGGESTIEEQVFVNARLDTAEELDGISVTEKTNRIEQLFEDENGYLEMEKLSGTDNLFTDINLNTTVKKLVLECDLRYESTLAATQVFYLPDATGTAQVNKSVVQFNEGSITVGGRTVSLRKNRWNTLSMVLDFSDELFDFYINGALTAEDVKLS